MERSKNDFWDYLEHGQQWKEHKYIRIENGKYIYPEDLKTSKNNKPSTMSPQRNRNIKGEPAQTTYSKRIQNMSQMDSYKDIEKMNATLEEKYEADLMRKIRIMEGAIRNVRSQLASGKDPVKYPIEFKDGKPTYKSVPANTAKMWLDNEEDGDVKILNSWKEDLKLFKAGKGVRLWDGSVVDDVPKDYFKDHHGI